MFLESIEGSPLPSHTKMLFPWCDEKIEALLPRGMTRALDRSWVMPLSKLRALERLPKHEDALKGDLLDQLTAHSTQPSCAYSFFISQNWEGAEPDAVTPHPDNEV